MEEAIDQACSAAAVLLDEHAPVEITWENWLGPLMADLPPFDLVVGELRPQIEALVQ